MWLLTALWLALSGVVAAVRCPDGRLCQGLDVCCLEPSQDGYTCCPLSLAFPHSLPMIPASSVANPAGTVCPDGTRCPVEYSCLRTSAGSFGCCPLSEAVSCADGRHCCPRGAHCGVSGKVCFTLPGLPAVGAVQCPDGQSECPNESTCCVMPNGSWGCCPMPQASCCADRIHCCPHATTCDLAHSRCLSPSGEQPMGRKVPAQKRAPWLGVPASPAKITCPDNKSLCPGGTTCCQLPSSQYGCCPLQNAVCCQDHIHCCPKGYRCNPASGTCQSPGASIPWLEKTPSQVRTTSKGQDVQCDEQTSCPDGNTCCRLATGEWGCCPLKEAVCCQDHIHCCPKGYTCDPTSGACQEPGASIPWLEKTPARVRATSWGQDVPCDEQTSCPDDNTCCRLATGEWGCCPLKEAVCCQDHIHCCPKGYTCDPTSGACQEPGASIPWLEKTPARVRATSWGQDVPCDEQTSCPDDNTCCRLATGEWGCCPLTEAVCCQDHIHCCPKGYTCDPTSGACQEPGASIPWLEKTPARVRATSWGQDVPCDEQTSCPDDNTCCRLATGEWGCCPLKEAVCCQDHIHCCPKGYTCDPASGVCQEPGASILWLEKTPARVKVTFKSQDVQCDQQTSCPNGNTCCKLVTGAWGCCPEVEAVCCQDHIHCCPKGYTCDVGAGTCQVSSTSIPWLKKIPAQVTEISKGRDVQCNQQTSCPEGNTCCSLETGAWGCCPFVEAVCCQDHIHCCPNGYTCDLEHGRCQENLLSMPWLPKTPAYMTNTLQSRVVKCDETFICEDGQTCCKSVTGTWACCHLPNAVCCEDHQHCCPSGYTCNLATQSCEKQQMLPEAKSPSTALLPASLEPSNDVPCDAQHFCHDRQTCCKAASGAWACCPYKKGTCCSDGLHCCPRFFRCSKSGLSCKLKWLPPWDTGAFIPPAPRPQPLL